MPADEEKQRLVSAVLISSGLLGLLWVVLAVEFALNVSFARFGVQPLTVEGLKGILFAPLIHGNIGHLISNSVPLFLLTAALFYYYRSHAWQIFILSWLVSGLWLWLFARGTSYHIGASGVVYALTSYHFISGIIRKEPKLIAFTLLVTFLYGSFVWGIFPDFALKERISWESHLMGLILGIVLAWAYKDVGPQRKVYEWPEEDDEVNDEIPEEQAENPDKSNSSELNQ